MSHAPLLDVACANKGLVFLSKSGQIGSCGPPATNLNRQHWSWSGMMEKTGDPVKCVLLYEILWFQVNPPPSTNLGFVNLGSTTENILFCASEAEVGVRVRDKATEKLGEIIRCWYDGEFKIEWDDGSEGYSVVRERFVIVEVWQVYSDWVIWREHGPQDLFKRLS